MPINIQQQDYNIMSQPYINKYMKLNILNFNLNVVDEISGNLMTCDVSVDADSDLRRSCNVSLVVTDSSFDVASGNKVWLDKFIQPLVGYENIYTGEIQWYNQGIYLINAPTYAYDAATNTLSFSGLDLMSKLTGLRNGALPGVPTVIPQDSNVREAMIAAIKLAGFTKYVVDECTNTDGSVQAVPYDIQIEQGGYIFDLIQQLRDILPNYQVYFDVNGVFHYDQIPSGDGEPVMIDDDLWNDILISETVSTDFEKVKNSIEVYGRSHSITDYSSSTTTSGAQISLTIANYTATAGRMIGFTLSNNVAGNITIKVNSLVARNLVDSNGAFIKELAKDIYYVAIYQSDNTYLFLGHQQAQATIQDTNPNSPFYIHGSVGEIREVLYGGDYDNIMSDELALQRAKLELYWKCRLNDSINLSCIPIPWLDVNVLISHAPRGGTQQKQYMIKSFSVSYGDMAEMSIDAISYYAYYNDEGGGDLPGGYTKLSYIQSTGTQYIDTEYEPSNTMRLVMDFEPTTLPSSHVMPAGVRNTSSGGNQFVIGWTGHKSPAVWRSDFGDSQVNFSTSITGVARHILDKNGASCTMDLTTIQNTASTFESSYNLYLFAGNQADTAVSQISMKLYACKIYDNNVLVRDFVPCKTLLGTIGLYDTVTKLFFANGGTGDFIGE